MSQNTISVLHLSSRIAAAILGGYIFTWGFIAFCLTLLYACGVEFHDANSVSYIIGFLVYLIVFLWALAYQRLSYTWLVLGGGGMFMALAASVIQSLLVP